MVRKRPGGHSARCLKNRQQEESIIRPQFVQDHLADRQGDLVKIDIERLRYEEVDPSRLAALCARRGRGRVLFETLRSFESSDELDRADLEHLQV